MVFFSRILTRHSQRISPKTLILNLTIARLFSNVCKSVSFDPHFHENGLLAKLLNEPASKVKFELDCHELLEFGTEILLWEPLITTLGSLSPKKALQVLEWRLGNILKEKETDPRHYSDLISLSGKLQNIPFSLRVFTSMESQGIRPNTATFNSLISACGLSGNMIMANSLFEIMNITECCKPNLDTYNAFIFIYSRSGDSKNIKAWFSAIKSTGFSPDLQTFEFFITGSIRAQKFDDVQRFYDEMVLAGITPNLPILEFMIEGLCKQKKLSEVKEFLKFIVKEGWILNDSIGKKLFGLYLDLGRIKEMEELLVLLGSVKNSTILFQVHCGIIRFYALSDKLDDLEYSVGRMLKEGKKFQCPGLVQAVICSYFRNEAYERLNLFLDRIRDSHVLDRSTYDLLVAGYRRVGLSDKLNSIIEDMKNASFYQIPSKEINQS